MPEADNDRRALLNEALTALEQMQVKLDEAENAHSEPIAIVGMGCRWPGEVADAEGLWELLRAGKDAVGEVPADRWNIEDYYDADPSAAGKMYMRLGGFLDRIDGFDAQFFRISPREAESLDVQQRLILQTAWEALEHAGCLPSQLKGSSTGVFVGIGSSDYSQLSLLTSDLDDIDAYSGSGSGNCFAAGRLSFFLGLQGPSMAVDTACSSSLVSVHLACQSLRAGECELALAGGVNAIITPYLSIYLSRTSALAADGRCKVFDEAADGFVRGEGCGMVVLKRLSDALRDGDLIMATLRGSAVNQDGASSGLTVPNGTAQQSVIRAALNNARLSPSQISFVEAHGTGTSLGDPIEMGALTNVLGEGRTEKSPLIVGSIKANIGHAEAAAGIAGFMKAVLCLYHRQIPPQLHFNRLNPHIDLHGMNLQIPTRLESWEAAAGERYAGVSSFGLSGTNVHIILGEAPLLTLSEAETSLERPVQVLNLSAASRRSLGTLASKYASRVLDIPVAEMANVCYSANTGRENFEYRCAVTAASADELGNALSMFAGGLDADNVVSGQVTRGKKTRIAFLFSGQGSQYPGMARELYDSQPVFRQALDECAEYLSEVLDRPLLSVVFGEDEDLLGATNYTQPALFSLEYALASVWKSWGIVPSIVLGHSVGEFAAACVAGLMDLETGLKLIAERGRLMQELAGTGGMAAVFASEKDVVEIISNRGFAVAIAAINSPENVVISGAESDLQAALTELEQRGFEHRRLDVALAFHSPLMEPMVAPFRAFAGKVTYKPPHKTALISNLTGVAVSAESPIDADYWARHVLRPVRFDASVQTLLRSDVDVVIEIGPKPVLIGMAWQSLIEHSITALPSLREGESDWMTMATTAAALQVNGAALDWRRFDDGLNRRRVDIPKYQFQDTPTWLQGVQGGDPWKQKRRGRPQESDHALIGEQIAIAGQSGMRIWQREILLSDAPYIRDHQVQGTVIVPATAFLEMALEASLDLFGPVPVAISDADIHRPILLTHDDPMAIQVSTSLAEDGRQDFKIHSRRAPSSREAAEQPWILNFEARLRTLSAEKKSTRKEFEEARERCAQYIDGAEFYRRQADKGNQWGPSFQGIRSLWLGEKECITQVEVPESIRNHRKGYCFHPAIADACGQLLSATIDMESSSDPRGGAFIAGGIEELRFYRIPATDRYWNHARLETDDGSPDNVLVGNVEVFDESFELVAETIGARLWHLSENERKGLESSNNAFYELEWKPLEYDERNNGTSLSGHWLILTDRGGIGKALAPVLESAGASASLISYGGDYGSNDSDRIVIRPDNKEDMERMIEKERSQHGAITGIVHLWGLDAEHGPDTIDFETDVAATTTSALHLVQSVTSHESTSEPRVWLVTRGAQSASKGDTVPNPIQATLWGLGRTFATETSGIWGGVIDLDSGGSANEAAVQLAGEFGSIDGEQQIAYRGGKRFVARLVRASARFQENETISRSTDRDAVNRSSEPGTLLITGGLRGLGFAIATWLVDRGAKHLCLLGRSPASAETSQRLDELRKRGATVLEVQGDVSVEADVRRVIQELQGSMPPLEGIVHCAGVLDDGVIAHLSSERFATVMEPKVIGAWNLHLATRDLPLKLFVMFSSVASLLGSPGQGNYAAANAFLDALAHNRRCNGLAAQSINWGAWSDIGMVARQKLDERVASQGVRAFSPAEGLELFHQMLRHDPIQIAVISIDWSIWERLYGGPARTRFFENFFRTPVDDQDTHDLTREVLTSAGAAEIVDLFEEFLQGEVGRILKLPRTEVRCQEPLSSMGFDSLMAVELKNRVEMLTGVTLSMVRYVEGPSIVNLATMLAEEFEATKDNSTEGAGPKWEAGEI